VRPLDPDRSVWRNGELTESATTQIDLADPGIQHGLGLFETLAVREGVCLDLDEHVERLLAHADELLERRPGRDAIRRTLETAAREKPHEPGWLKLIVTAAGEWYVFGGACDPHEEGRPIRAVLLPWRRGPRGPLAGLKTLNYGANALGRRYASERSADEGLWLNHRGRLVEGCWSNLFVLRSGRLFTPSTREGLLPGVVRARVIGAARELGIPVHDPPLKLKRLLHADHVFVTSSLRGLCTVTHLDGRPLRWRRGNEVVDRLAGAIGRRHRTVAGATLP
jgi:branched-subunit amino acid aminotransferase/4-amino-4-deoxychorismate lyase